MDPEGDVGQEALEGQVAALGKKLIKGDPALKRTLELKAMIGDKPRKESEDFVAEREARRVVEPESETPVEDIVAELRKKQEEK